jgi:hypothetical protein
MRRKSDTKFEQIKTTCAISMTIILFAYICLSACASDMPVSDKAVAVHLRLSEGWWIQINQDGSGSFGFGVLMDLVRVSKGTFAFADVLDDIKRVFPRRPKYAEEPYKAVSYLEKQCGFGLRD